MKTLPSSPDLAHLTKQAKHLLRDARAGEDAATRRVLATLPAARGLAPEALADHPLGLHDAQSVVAREYGFPSWTILKRYVEWRQGANAERLGTWLRWIFEGHSQERRLAVRLLDDEPQLLAGDPWLACVIGDTARIGAAIARDAGWVGRAGGPFAMPPLVAVTHSRLIADPRFEAPLLASARLLLREGADVNGTWVHGRWPDSPLSVLHGAAGRTHHVGMMRLLLEAGAVPDDGESLYHSVESASPDGTRLLIEAGARVTKTNAIGRVLDYDKLDLLQYLLAHGGDARERPWVHHAILRNRSLAHVRALLAAGADPRGVDDEGVSLYRWASMQGRTDVVALLEDHGVGEALTETDLFVAAAARGDEPTARAIAGRTPDILARLTPPQLQTLPRMAEIGAIDAVRTILTLGWPREVKAGWDATALNHAVFLGDAAMAGLLLGEGADWRTEHGFGDNVIGSLSAGSRSDEIEGPAPKDYVGCAEALLAHGVPRSAFSGYTFSEEVAARVQDADSEGAGA